MSALKIGFKPYVLISAGVSFSGSGTCSLRISFVFQIVSETSELSELEVNKET